MLNRSQVIAALNEYCIKNGVPTSRAINQIRAIGKDVAILCVRNPNAPPSHGLANDVETLMLPTLYIHKTENGLEYEETEHTGTFLKKAEL